MCPITIKCKHCGFTFYHGNQLKSIYDVLRLWGYRCPVCLSPCGVKPSEWFIRVGFSGDDLSDIDVKARIKLMLHEATTKCICSDCGRLIYEGDIYWAKTGYAKRCLICAIKRLSAKEVKALMEVMKEKYNKDLKKYIEEIRQRPIIR